MIVHWQPCRDDRRRYSVDYTQPTTDVLAIGDAYEVDLSDTSAAEYIIPSEVTRWLQRAWREADGLHVQLVAFYTREDASVWERKPFRGTTPEDYGTAEAITWSD